MNKSDNVLQQRLSPEDIRALVLQVDELILRFWLPRLREEIKNEVFGQLNKATLALLQDMGGKEVRDLVREKVQSYVAVAITVKDTP